MILEIILETIVILEVEITTLEIITTILEIIQEVIVTAEVEVVNNILHKRYELPHIFLL